MLKTPRKKIPTPSLRFRSGSTGRVPDLPSPHPNTPDSAGPEQKELHRACKKGDINTINKILKSNPHLLNSYLDSQTPLHQACSNGHLAVVKALISKGADINIRDLSKSGWYPIHCAAYDGHFEIISYLIKKGGDPNVRNTDRNSCLHYLARRQMDEKLEKALIYLIKMKALVDAKNNMDETPLQAAAVKGKKPVVEFLLSKKADINARNKLGGTALQKALLMGHEDTVMFLLENGANPSFKSQIGGDLLLSAKNLSLNRVSEALEKYQELWVLKHTTINKEDERWKTLQTSERLKESILVDTGNLNLDLMNEIVSLSETPNVSHHDGWIIELGERKVPTKISPEMEHPNTTYAKYFYEKGHMTFVGILFFAVGKAPEPLIVSVATHVEIDSEYKTLIWTIQAQ